MLISPPFLPARNANETDDAWIERCMSGGDPGQGAFPVSFNLGWHGGMHLNAPMNGTQPEPVRAIADGEVVFLRQPTAQPAGPLPPEHPQAYNGWTDNGVVVIRHATEIGEGADAAVTFFSITMHLSEIDPAIRQGRAVYRKARVGTAGQIYGSAQRQIHFEIVCDEANLARLTGRASGDLPLNADGRSDAVYGEMYFHLPVGLQVFAQAPLANTPHAMMQPPGQPAPAPQPLQAIHTTTEDLIVGLRYAEGEGANGNRGDAYVTTYLPDGTTLGAALEEDDAEYNLYTAATDISTAYPATGRPAPSSVYELLRFGRVIGPDALNPATVPHWRRVRYPGGQGWVNLNSENVRKFSDADFPQWRLWQLIDDAVGQDSRCDSPVIRGWLDANGDGQVSPTEATTRLGDATIAPKLARAICKFPTDWDAATIDARWGWLKTSTPENLQPLSNEDFERLRAHIAALAFWPGGMGIDAHHWHWQPREFIRHFRTCIWLTEAAMQRVYPGATIANVRRYRLDLNKCKRKYLVSAPFRLGHYYGQAAVESAQLRYMSELFNGDPFAYFRHYAKAKNYAGWLGNVEWNDGGTFRGRGFKQMTGRDNYANYWIYRGWLTSDAFTPRWWRNPGWWGLSGATVTAAQYNTLPTQNAATVAQLVAQMRPAIIATPDVVSNDLFNCIDTAGWFWAKNRLIATADLNDAAQMTRLVRGDGPAVGVTIAWPAAAHFPDRQAHTNRIIALVGDEP